MLSSCSKKEICIGTAVFLVIVIILVIIGVVTNGGSQDSSAPSKLIGQWQVVDDDEYLEFFSDGTCTIGDSHEQQGGTYTAEDGRLKIESRWEAETYDYEIRGNTLTISRGGDPIELERIR